MSFLLLGLQRARSVEGWLNVMIFIVCFFYRIFIQPHPPTLPGAHLLSWDIGELVDTALWWLYVKSEVVTYLPILNNQYEGRPNLGWMTMAELHSCFAGIAQFPACVLWHNF